MRTSKAHVMTCVQCFYDSNMPVGSAGFSDRPYIATVETFPYIQFRRCPTTTLVCRIIAQTQFCHIMSTNYPNSPDLTESSSTAGLLSSAMTSNRGCTSAEPDELVKQVACKPAKITSQFVCNMCNQCT
jgi:hypothetical protein